MRLEIYTSKNEFVSMIIQAINYDPETIVQEVSATSTLLVLEYKCDNNDIYYTLTMCVNDKGESCDVIVHELKRTACGKNLSANNAYKKIRAVLLEQNIGFKVIETDSPLV